MTVRVKGRAAPAVRRGALGGPTAERLARLAAIVESLRRDDAAAERERVLQYDAVERLRRAGVLTLRVPRATAARAAVCATCWPRSFRSRAAVPMWRKHFGRISGSPSAC